jgi:autotransporter translocation and assembly factor TamB
MNTIRINGKSITVSGNNISVVNNKIYVDGKLIDEPETREVQIEFIGDLASLECNDCIVKGDVKGDVEANNVNCQNVHGDIDANVVNCNNVTGKVKANVVNHA